MGKRRFDREAEERHHIVYQANHWNSEGYASLLHNHEYLIKSIPRDTLHRDIHRQIADIPMPGETECRRAFLEIERRLEEGEISVKDDTIEQRIDVLLETWTFDLCPRTFLLMKWQKEIVSDYYRRSSYLITGSKGGDSSGEEKASQKEVQEGT